MRVVIQRVSQAGVEAEGKEICAIGKGMLILLGIEEADSQEDIDWLTGKISRLRIFDDANGVMNIDIGEAGGEVLVVSQFTLHASTKKGNRPSYIRAARPEKAIPLYEKFTRDLEKELDSKVKTGVFGAIMQVRLINDGPVTIIIDSRSKE
jgi:D-tyrosyl-tRNA(Tyr) deacylase